MFEKAVFVTSVGRKAVFSLIHQVSRATAFDDDGQSRGGRLQCDVAKGFDGTGKEKHIRAGVSCTELLRTHPATKGGIGQGCDLWFARSRSHDEGVKVQSAGVQSMDDTAKDVGSLFGHESSHPQEYGCGIVNPEGASVFVAAIVRAECLYVDATSPDFKVGDAIHFVIVNQVSLNKGCRNIECLQEVVLVSKKGSENVFEPRESGIMFHVFGNVGMIGSHDG